MVRGPSPRILLVHEDNDEPGRMHTGVRNAALAPIVKGVDPCQLCGAAQGWRLF